MAGLAESWGDGCLCKGLGHSAPGATVTVTSLAAGTVELSLCLGPHC